MEVTSKMTSLIDFFANLRTPQDSKNELRRNEWIQQELSKIKPGTSILDAGAGELKYKPLCQHLKYTSQDKAEYSGTGDGKGLQMGKWDTSRVDIVSDIAKMPVESETFDSVLCVEVLEHVPDPIRSLAEMARVLKKNGTLILTAPFCALTHFAPNFHSTGFSRYFFKHHLEELGFTNIEITANGNFFEYLNQELIRLEDMIGRFSKMQMNAIQRRSINQIRLLLDQASNSDQGSSEVLCFGLMVKAIK